MIHCSCPHCQTPYELEDHFAGQKLRCANCQNAFVWSPAKNQAVKFFETPAPSTASRPRVQTPRHQPAPRAKKLVASAAVITAVFLASFGVYSVVTGQTKLPFGSQAGHVAVKKKLPSGPPAERVANYEEALARAKETGKDIVVFQRGSDWNRLGETLYNDVWQKDEFALELGNRFILVAVDHAEVVGGRAVQGTCSATYCGPTGFSNIEIGSTTPLRLAKLAEESAPLPADEITTVEGQDGSKFNRRADRAWLAEGKCPAYDDLALHLRPLGGGKVLRLDFLTDPSLPGAGPGRASNGNFAVSEIEVFADGHPIKLDADWANASEGDWGPWNAIDGIADKPDNVWNPAAHLHQRRTLLIALNSEVPAGSDVLVRLICRSQWPEHLPGCLRASILRDSQVEDSVRQVARAQLEKAKNRGFSWWDLSHCPRVALMDSVGRAVASEDKPRLGLTPESLAIRVKELRAVREKRDAFWAQADKTQGPQKAELLRKSLDLLGFANWQGNGNCYKFIHDQIRAADPKDESGAVRWLGFGGDVRSGVPWTEPNWSKALQGKDLTDKDYEEALSRIDKEMHDPRNRVLDHERIQRIMVAKYHVYKRWPKHEDQRFDVQREIAAFDPTTFWGIGAVGYLGMYHRSPVPMVTYGWTAEQVKPGMNVWDMKDTAYSFDHAGPYTLRMATNGGKDSLKIKRIALLDGAKVIADAKPNADLGPGHAPVEVPLEIKDWSADRAFVLHVEAEAAADHHDSQGLFSIEPQLPPVAATLAQQSSPSAQPESESSRLLAQGDIGSLQQKLGDLLMSETNKDASGVFRIVSTPALRAALAQYELIRCCGATAVSEVATRPDGASLLKALFEDSDWMETFLGSDAAEWAQSLENLRILSAYGERLDQPFPRKVATALALQWGNGSRYRLVDRFRDILRAEREGLLHISFENLSVREMRWSVPTFGSAKDYQFLLDDRQTTLGDYFGACNAIGYVDPNVYGDSVQTWLYITPWTHHYGTGTGNRPFPAHRLVGGVCGTLSGYGSAVAQVHGIMSTTVGQPGHCAYVIRVGQEWPVGNSVTWPTSASARGWDGTGYSTMHRLYEPVEQDQPHFLASLRAEWLARLAADRAEAHLRLLPGLRYSLYRQGVGNSLPDFSKLTPSSSGPCTRIDLASVQPSPAENFGVVWEGKAEVSGRGPLKITLQSDDGSRLLIDGQPIVAANCNRQEKELVIESGVHALRVEYYQGGGTLGLTLNFEGVLSASDSAWITAYDKALTSQPTNYLVWLDYIKALESARNVPQATWLDLARRAARTFSVCNEAGWALTQRCFEKASPVMAPADREAFLLLCHQDLRQEKWVKPEGYLYDQNLNWQADRIGDPARAVDFFGKLLSIHYSSNPNDNWIFGKVLEWGANRFAGAPATAPAYTKAMSSFFESRGSAIDKGMVATAVSTGIRKSSEAGDFVSYRLWTALAAKLLPPVKPEDVHLNATQFAAAPKCPTFPGVLLSKDGMLQTSSACQFDRPLSYGQILGGNPGWFDTNNEEKAWAQVQLAGDGDLTGIVLVNRYEYAPTQEEYQWAVPLKVSISTDAKTWTEVATFQKAESVLSVDLQGRHMHARYVRIERMPATDKSKPPGRFHFRNFLVYGTKLY